MWPLEPISFVKKHHSSFHRSSVDQRDPKIKARNWHFWCKNSLTYRSIVCHLQLSFSQFAVSPNHAVEVPVLKSHATVKSTVHIPGTFFWKTSLQTNSFWYFSIESVFFMWRFLMPSQPDGSYQGYSLHQSWSVLMGVKINCKFLTKENISILNYPTCCELSPSSDMSLKFTAASRIINWCSNN